MKKHAIFYILFYYIFHLLRVFTIDIILMSLFFDKKICKVGSLTFYLVICSKLLSFHGVIRVGNYGQYWLLEDI